MAERLDTYDRKPAALEQYLSHYGYHISKRMCRWAVRQMEDRAGGTVPFIEKEKLEELLRQYGIALKSNKAYDAVYVWCMGKADYLGSSIPDEAHLAQFVQDYLDDPDGSPSRAFDELYIKTVALGIPIDWEDVV